MERTIGIDLGTTNSVVSFYEGKTPGIVISQEGDRILPSVVAFTQKGERLVGTPAKSQLIINPANTVHSVKRLMGKRYSEIKPYLYQFSYPIVEGKNDSLKIQLNGHQFSPEEISAMILQKLKASAEQYLSSKIAGAIITVPAYFDDSQRQATKDAGEIAGLKVLRIINEPTAASLFYSLDLKDKNKALVYDFGGGTIDISVLEIENEVIKVLATAGNTQLGGNDLDILLSHMIIKEISEQYNIDLSANNLAVQRIRDASEIAKKELSSLEASEINLPFIAESPEGPIHFLKYITRNEFESLINEKIDQTINICSACLEKARLDAHDIDEILLVGGSTRIPMVQKKVESFFGKPASKKVNPDEIVAAGAAVQGAIISGQSKDILLLDVTPLSLGVKTFGGAFTRVIQSNTTIPCNRSLVFSTAEDNQQEVEIIIFQGEREIAEENKLLGKFTLKGIREAPLGVPRIEVTFNININGILTVSAVDLSTKSQKQVVVSNSGLLGEDEISRLKKNAEEFRQQDQNNLKTIKLKNNVLNSVYSIEELLKNPGINPEIIQSAQDLISLSRKAIERESVEDMKKTLNELKQISYSLESIIKVEKSKQEEEATTRKISDDTQPLKIPEP